jgi:Rieske Fe-S protein
MTDEAPREDPNRRTVLRGAALLGAGLPLLAACTGADPGSGGSSSSGGSASAGSGSSGSNGSGGSGSGGSGSGTTVAKSDVPVGGGKILAQDQVVVVQPTKGEFKAFSAICTHQGCTVDTIQGGQIICPCHGSHFSIKNGANTAGPLGSPAGSVQPLAAKKVTVKGSQLSIS